MGSGFFLRLFRALPLPFPSLAFFSITRTPFFVLSKNPLDLSPNTKKQKLKKSMIADGGVVIIDDFGFHVDSDWLGVNTAVYHFVLEQTRLVPFLYADNKLYLTTASHQEEYYKLLEKEDGVKCFKDGAEAGQFSLGNYKTCVFTSNFAYDCADAFLMRHRDDFRRRGVALRADDPEDLVEGGGKGGKDEL